MALAMAGIAGAASPWRESFDSGLNGWTNTTPPAWRWTNGYAFVTFPAIPTPQTATLVATGALASTAFVGNYGLAELGLIGFRFQAVQALPSGLTLRWMRGTNGYFRNLHHLVQATGVWYTVYGSLTDKDTGGWSGDDQGLFSFVLGDVDSVSLSILTPALLSAATFRVDDIQVDHLHRGSLLRSENGLFMQWERLQSNTVYRLEQCSGLDQLWTEDGYVLATNRTVGLSGTGVTACTIWRMVLP